MQQACFECSVAHSKHSIKIICYIHSLKCFLDYLMSVSPMQPINSSYWSEYGIAKTKMCSATSSPLPHTWSVFLSCGWCSQCFHASHPGFDTPPPILRIPCSSTLCTLFMLELVLEMLTGSLLCLSKRIFSFKTKYKHSFPESCPDPPLSQN